VHSINAHGCLVNFKVFGIVVNESGLTIVNAGYRP